MTQEALKLAFEALEEINKLSIGENAIFLPAEIDTAIDAIKEALAQTEQKTPKGWKPEIWKSVAQPEQEPVAYWNFNNGFSHCMIDQLNEAAKKNPAPLYTTPPQRTWVGLTDEERQDIALEVPMDAVLITEAKLKRKNGLAEEKKT